MKSRAMELHLLLLILALIGAWFSWFAQTDEENSGTETLIWDLSGASIDEIHYSSEKLNVTITAREGAEGAPSYFWAESARVADPPPNAPPNDPTPESIKKSFRVSHTGAEKARAALGRLVAHRSLPPMDNAKRADFGLAPAKAEIKVIASGKTHSLQVGMQAHGANLRYICEDEKSACFVIKGGVIDDLKWADSRLYERNLFRLKKSEVVGLSITCGEKSTRWTRPDDGDAKDGADNWTLNPTRDEETTETSPQKWLNQLFRIRAVSYLPDAKAPKQLLRAKLEQKTGDLLWIELAKKGPKDAPIYLARSSQSDTWVQTSTFLGKEMETELPSLCGP